MSRPVQLESYKLFYEQMPTKKRAFKAKTLKPSRTRKPKRVTASISVFAA